MKLFFIFFLLIITLSSLANNQINPKIPTSAFIENVGQLEEMTTLKPVNDVLFYVSTPDAFMYLRKNGISYVFHKSIFSVKEEYDMGIPKIEKVEWQRVDVDFVNSSTERVIKEEQVDWKYNFYYAHCPSGITGVRAYKSVTYKNIYPGIDWHIYYNSEGELKYDFIVNPGANPSLIRLQYNYSNKPKLDIDGSVLVENDLGSIIENKPFAYQEIENIPIKWIVNDNILSFDIDSYNKKSPLIIDPFLIWSTYMGSSGTDYSEGVATDDNMLVVSGYTTSSSFPTVNPGGTAFFQGSLVSSSDAYIAKFSTNGIPDWITYYGGSGNDNNNGRVLLTPNYIFVAGQTGSNDFPTFDPGNGAYYDGVFPTNGDVLQGYILKFDRNGERLWATYLDGNPDPGYIASITANSSAFYSLAVTMSSNFPTVDPGGGAYFQPTITNTNITHYAISKFNINTNAMEWSTYFSTSTGSDGDWNNVVCDDNYLFLVGNTSSTSFLTIDPGNGAYYQGSSSGSRDGIIARFSTQGVLEWSTYFGGSGDDEFRAATIANGKLWLAGNSTSTNFPTFDIGNGAYYQPAIGGGADGIVASFDLSGHLLWSTYYGGSGNDYSRAITADNYGLWFSGQTTSANFPLLNLGTPTYYLSSASSAFLVKFKQNGIRQWSTYIKATAPRRLASNSSSIYLAGYTSSGNLVTQDPSNGSYFQLNHAGGTYDAFIMQFDKCVIPVVNISKDTSFICRYDSTWIYGHGGIMYNWSTSDIIDSIHVSPASTSTYYLTVTDDMTCQNNDSITITVYPLPDVHLTGAHPICYRDSIELYGNGAQTYLWMPDSLLGDSIHFSPSTTITYYVLGTDTNNCRNIDSAQIIVHPLPDVYITGEHPICFKDSIMLHGNGAQTYQWMPDSLLGDSIHVSPPITTAYYILGTDTNNCKNIDSAQVVIYPLPIVSITGEHPICFGDSIVLFANGAQTYNWTPGNDTTDSIHVAPNYTTTYYLLGTDTNQCKNIDSADVIVYSLPNVQIAGTHPICFGDSIALTASGAITYVWYPDTLTGNIQIYSPDSTSTYIVQGTDFHQCRNTDTATVVVYNLPNVQILGAHPICFGDYIDLTAINAEHYVWNTTDTTSNIHVNPPQTFDFIVVGTDTNGCVNSDTSQVVVNPLPPVRIFGVQPICHYDSISIAAFGANTYTWSPWGYLDPNITVSPDSTTFITLVGVDGNGCVNSDTATLVVYPLPIVTVSGDHPICFGDSITVSAHGAYVYDWSPVSVTGDSITIAPGVTTSYTVLGTDTNQCKNTADFSITVFELPVAQITGIDRICQQEEVTLQASGGDSYIWNTTETTTNILVQPMQTTTYSVIAIKNICSDTAFFTLSVDPKPSITLTSDTTIIIGMTLPLNVSGANTYIWSPVDYLSCTSCNNPTTRPSETIEYCVEGVNIYGCSDTACVIVTVDKECGETFVPSAFSPNGDGNNDFLFVRGKCIKSMSFSIYNRWGEKVFESSDPDIGWDGSFRGKALDTGVFVYVLQAEYYNDVIINQRGNITLVR